MSVYATRRTAMVDTQVRPSDVTKFPIIDAMLSLPREAFVPTAKREVAYLGDNLELGQGRVVLEPRTLAKFLDALAIEATDTVLVIGAGLGYSSAVAAHMADAVIALEEDEAMARDAEATFSDQGIDNVAVTTGPLAEGAAAHGPYDIILVEGAVERMPPEIEAQVKEGGRIAALFMDKALGTARIGYKIDGTVTWRFSFNAAAPVLPGFEAQRAFVL